MAFKVLRYFLGRGGVSALTLTGVTLMAVPTPGLPPPEDTPEEVLRTEVLTEARSPLNGEPLTAAEYAELQAALRSTEAVQPQVSAKIRRLIGLLKLRKVIRRIVPFLVP